jgi:hypothetical protein
MASNTPQAISKSVPQPVPQAAAPAPAPSSTPAREVERSEPKSELDAAARLVMRKARPKADQPVERRSAVARDSSNAVMPPSQAGGQQAQSFGRKDQLRSAQAAPAAPVPQSMAETVQVTAAPASVAEKVIALLSFDYSVTSQGVQMLPGEDGYAALLASGTAGAPARVVSSTRVRKGFASVLPFPQGSSGQTFQVVLSREAAAGPAPAGALSDAREVFFKAPAASPVARLRQKAMPSQDAAAAKPAISSGRAVAESASASRVSVEVTAPPQ